MLVTQFCFCVYGVVVYFIMSSSLQNALKFLKFYSPPPSHLIALKKNLIWFSTKALKTLSLSSTLNLIYMLWNNVFLDKSSMKVKKYFTFPWSVVAMGLHRSMCISPRLFFAWEPHSKEMGHDGWCIPKLFKRPKMKSQKKSCQGMPLSS